LQRTPLRVERDPGYFRRWYLLQYVSHQSVAVPLKRKPFGG
jgi:hypothetical protein